MAETPDSNQLSLTKSPTRTLKRGYELLNGIVTPCEVPPAPKKPRPCQDPTAIAYELVFSGTEKTGNWRVPNFVNTLFYDCCNAPDISRSMPQSDLLATAIGLFENAIYKYSSDERKEVMAEVIPMLNESQNHETVPQQRKRNDNNNISLNACQDNMSLVPEDLLSQKESQNIESVPQHQKPDMFSKLLRLVTRWISDPIMMGALLALICAMEKLSENQKTELIDFLNENVFIPKVLTF